MHARPSSIRSRRDLLIAGAALCAAPVQAVARVGAPAAVVHSVTGPLAPQDLGLTLAHEHLFSIFGAEPTDAPEYDQARVLATVGPYLRYLRALGCRTVVDATAMRFGRQPQLLRALSRASGLKILTNTGAYGAADDRYVPDAVRTASAESIAARWIAEAGDGIDGTGIRPGFIKIGVDAGPLSALDRRLVEAGALTHRATGLTIAVHTGDNPVAARAQLDVLHAQGVDPSAWIWIHASASSDDQSLWDVAGRGGWLGLDGLRAETYDRHLALVLDGCRRGLGHRLLLSHDGNSWPMPGRLPRPYDLLLTTFRRRLVSEGLSEATVQALLIDNPRAAFAGGVRLRAA